MAIVHPAELKPSKLELLAAWLPTQSWYTGTADIERVATFRLDDPALVAIGEIGLDADGLFESTLNRHVHVLNDADAAGVAEMKFGAGKRRKGLVIMTTLGTGIGTALFMDGNLVPNAELGHLEIDGVDYETKAAFSAKERENLTFDQWAERLQKYYSTLERLFSPDLIIVGGGISKQWEEFLPKLNLRAEIVPALKRNNAGILGAAALAWKHSDKE